MIANIFPKSIFNKLINEYYAKIHKLSDFTHLIHDREFIESSAKNPATNVALYGDHGLHHVMNVAEQIPGILKSVHGIQIPRRNTKRLKFIQNYGVILGLIHDIGMSDVSAFGREMHGEFVAQEVFKQRFAPIFKAMWHKNIGGIPNLLVQMHKCIMFKQDPELIFREMLSLACCHRKQLVPVNILNDRQLLKDRMQYFITNSLQYQYANKKNPIFEVESDKSFTWLLSTNKKMRDFIDDVIDTLRILRCSDALRSRGTDLKTSAQFQVFVDQFTAQTIYALTNKNGHMYFLEVADPVSSGEANVANICLTKECDLRFAFHRGLFRNKNATECALNYLAMLITQLDHDISDTFIRDPKTSKFMPLKRPRILLETTEDFPGFVDLLVAKLLISAKKVVSLKEVPTSEYRRYMDAGILNWNTKKKKDFLKKIAVYGYKTSHIDIKKAFDQVRLIIINSGSILFEAKEFSGFVYFPFTSGLEGTPTGSYSSFKVAPFTPLGATGIIRGAPRNATVIAQKSVKILAIPKDIYLLHWYATYSKKEFIKLIKKLV